MCASTSATLCISYSLLHGHSKGKYKYNSLLCATWLRKYNEVQKWLVGGILGLASLVLDVHPQDNRPFTCPWEELSSWKHISKFILQWACRLNRSNALCFRYVEINIMTLVVLGWDLGSRFSLPLIRENLGWKAVPLQATKKVMCAINIFQAPWSKSLVWKYVEGRNN